MIGAPRSEGALKRVRTQSLEPVRRGRARTFTVSRNVLGPNRGRQPRPAGRQATSRSLRPSTPETRNSSHVRSVHCGSGHLSCGGFVNTSPFSALRFCSARLDLPSTSKAERARKTNRPSTILRFASWSGHPRPSSRRSGPLALGRRCAGRYRPIRHVITYAQVFVRACRSPHACVRFTGLSRHAHVLCVRHSRGFACASV